MASKNNAVPNKLNDHLREIIFTLPSNISSRDFKDGTFIFSAYGCALVERKTDSGTYVYTAVNLKTRKSAILSRRANPLKESGFYSMVSSISMSPVCGESRFSADKRPDEVINSSILNDIVNCIFTQILPKHGYAVREKQIKLAEHILGVIGRRGITLAESEVGTGKTHAYLIASLLAKRGRINDHWLRGHYKGQSWVSSAYMTVIISTSSIALQEAIVSDYIPELSRILLECGVINTPLTAFVRKGKEHYICEERLRRYYGESNIQTKRLLAPFIGIYDPFDLTSADKLTPYMKRKICVKDRCSDSCKYINSCRYQEYLKKAKALRQKPWMTIKSYTN